MGRFPGNTVVRVIETFHHEPGKVAVGEAVNNAPSLAAGHDEPTQPELGQMLADAGAGSSGMGNEGIDIRGLVHKVPDKLKPGRIRKHPE